MAYLSESLPLPEHTFVLLSALIEERLGLHYGPDKREILQDRLAGLAAEHQLDSFLDYYYLLKYSEDNQDEWRRVQSALAVRETYFWREVDQIQLTAHKLAPEILRQRSGKPVRIWHAACATGEEPYSLAIALREAGIRLPGLIEIVATDFDQESLLIARQATYRERSFRALPAELRRKYFNEHKNGVSSLVEELRSEVKFHYLNLVDREAMARYSGFDIIFCRNVFIYFDTPTIEIVANRFFQALNTPGYLFLGAAESLLRLTTPFELSEIEKCFVYTKK